MQMLTGDLTQIARFAKLLKQINQPFELVTVRLPDGTRTKAITIEEGDDVCYNKS
jgi:hypothetical protein